MMKRLLPRRPQFCCWAWRPRWPPRVQRLAQPGVSQDSSTQANVPSQGKADTSGGAAEQSSANPSSKSVKSSAATLPDN